MTSGGDALQSVGPETGVLSHAPASAADPTNYGFCSWHNRFASDVRLVSVDEQGSGGGTGVQYACPPCITTHHLTPFADQP